MAKKLSDIDDDLFDFDDEEEVEEGHKKKKLRPLKLIFGLLFFTALAVVGLIGGKKLLEHFAKEEGPKASKTKIGVEHLFEVKEGSYPLILDGEISEYRVYEFDGRLYLNRNLVVSEIDCRFYYDEETLGLLYTTAEDTFTFIDGVKGYTDSKGNLTPLEYAPVLKNENGYYIALEMLDFGRVMAKYEVYEEPKRVSLWTYEKENAFDNYEITKNTALREGNSIIKDILIDLKKGDRVTVINSDDEEFHYVFAKGVYGYVDKKCVSEEVLEVLFVKNEPYSQKKIDYKVSLGWAQVTNKSANQYIMEKMNATSGVNTVSPTWYSISDESGNIESLATAETVNELKNAGYKVWPLVADFMTDIDTDALLKSKATRNKIIEYLMAEAKLYGYEGYNIDFEDINADSADDFLQFLRELMLEANKAGLVISSDNYVPMEHTSFYNRGEQGKVVDYVVVMAYDEHYAGSPEAGSVASLPFVKKGIADTVNEVGDASRVIVGLPFYARLWSETPNEDGTIKLKSQAYGMTGIEEKIAASGAEKLWSEELGQFYVTYTEGEVVYQAWLEDLTSYEEKMKVVAESGIAGVAFWRLGLEDPAVYEVINKYLQE